MSNIEHVPAGAPPAALDFGEMLRRAKVIAASGLVPKALENNPEAVALVGAKGAELGVPFITALHEIHIIDKKPSPSAQLRLALVRRAGHEVRFPTTNSERCVVRGRRREYRDDPDAWTEVEWTIADAERAGLLDQWVERWQSNPNGKNYLEKFVLGQVIAGIEVETPEWAAALVRAGKVQRRENWWRYPAEMLRARAISAIARLEFGDVLSGLGLAEHTPEEMGLDLGHDVDLEEGEADRIVRQAAAHLPDDDEPVDAEIVEHDDTPAEPQHLVMEPPTPPETLTVDEPPAEYDPIEIASRWNAEQWARHLGDEGISEARALRHVRKAADELGIEKPLAIDKAAAIDTRLVAALLDLEGE